MTAEQVLSKLETLGSDQIKKILMKHGAKEPLFGVKVEDLKKVQKEIKEDTQSIAMELYNSGNADAMYLAGLMANGAKMTEKELQHWVNNANSPSLSEYTVPWVTAENPKGWAIALKWIDSKKELVAAAGWNTLSGILSLRPDAELDIENIRRLMDRVKDEIQTAPNRVKYTMNGFIIAAGSYVAALTAESIQLGRMIGVISVDMNGTACKVPFSPDYILKVKEKGVIGKKKKTVKC
ncbi:DNA alkylation repair protein [Pseudoflavitalea sp. G-6-1-2]|uniref:DNA alkylation repair protein n=1 Tax=Pseudoflavitalea sp. G-6-1-2 TaxID=2728841 RepID=UPI00146CE231|nr:DNA alkylation repair protein [Pseudoflavitalea sp. G-6-1-2]NML23409.1 DNA alkylation repair protein [Pseudoflavitalea sp. G-6-1-2]